MFAWLRSSRAAVGGVSAVGVALMATGIATPALADDDFVTFGDSTLAECVAEALGIDDASQITATALADLTELTCNEPSIGSLVGLEGAYSLESLDLYGALRQAEGTMTYEERVEATRHMLEPLTGLTGLVYLDISGGLYGGSYSPAPLATLTSLQFLWLDALPGHDLDFLSPLHDLTFLSVRDGVGISDVSALSNLTKLAYLDLNNLGALDLSPIADLHDLAYLSLVMSYAPSLPSFAGHDTITYVDLSGSHITDLGDFSGSALAYLDLTGSSVTDLTPLVGAADLTGLDATRTMVSSVSALANATELEELYLNDADVRSIAPLTNAPKLQYLDLDKNQLLDISPLSTMKSLVDWTAKNQWINLPTMTACTLAPVATPVSSLGTPIQVTGTKGFAWNGQAIAPGYGEVKFTSAVQDDGRVFSVTQRAQVDGASTPCEWPAGWLPSLTMPTEISTNQSNGPTFTGGSIPPELVWRATWTYDTPAGAGSSGYLHYWPTDVDLTGTVSVNAFVDTPGMRTYSTSAGPFTIYGGFPTDLSFAFDNPPLVGYASSIPDWDVPEGATRTCAWFANGALIPAATKCSYTPSASLAGKKLSATVTLERANYRPGVYTIPGQTVMRVFGEVNYIGRVNETSLSNWVDAGAKLAVTLNPTYFGVTPTAYTYQWTRNGVAIPGAKGKSYTTTTADAGTKVAVEITALKSGYVPSTTEAIDIYSVRKRFIAQPTPAISGLVAAGSTVKVFPGSWGPTPTSTTYQWYLNGKAVPGATKSTYKLPSTSGGKKVTVRVLAKKSGYTSASRTSASVTVLKRLTSTPVPTISGTAKVRATLTAKAGAWLPGTVAKTYQWYRNGKAIPGATHASYAVRPTDAYTSITVKITGKKSGYVAATTTSKATVPSGIKYASCAALLVDYPGGVATSSSTVDQVSGTPGGGILPSTYVSSRLYAWNAGRDDDKDGWACEPS